MIKRHTKILEIVGEAGRIDVNTLAAQVGVSTVTLRKDLDLLSEQKLLTREHGYAVSGNVDDVGNRLSIRYEIKVKIAREAARMVSAGETVMIESGSTCALLARELARTGKDVCIITNSAFIAGYIRDQGDVRVILLGGEYQKESQVMVGPLVRSCAAAFHVDKLFVGMDGFDREYGFSTSDMMRTDAMKGMSASAKKTIILTESGKFAHAGVITQLSFGDVYAVVTDDGIDHASLEILKEQGIEVLLAKAD
ncbi:MAG: DeoR/GlpR transcriptional regulator [Lachnospiraceae bacterium]|nr:DeoR/GlpR transcriptional regulator [Lachnospiraceae bacterium]